MALRRIVGAASRWSPQSAKVRHYAVPSTYSKEEPDPQLNGYPQLPWVSRQHLPAYGWQDPLMRRNFGDTVCHILASILNFFADKPHASVT